MTGQNSEYPRLLPNMCLKGANSIFIYFSAFRICCVRFMLYENIFNDVNQICCTFPFYFVFREVPKFRVMCISINLKN